MIFYNLYGDLILGVSEYIEEKLNTSIDSVTYSNHAITYKFPNAVIYLTEFCDELTVEFTIYPLKDVFSCKVIADFEEHYINAIDLMKPGYHL